MRCLDAAVLAGMLLAAPGARAGIVDEIRLGGFEHDSGVVGTHKEPGADLGLEVLFSSPGFLRGLHAPRPVLGLLGNTAGRTNQVYFGLTDRLTLFEHVFRPDDSIYLQGTLAAGFNDGKGNVQGTRLASSWKSHGIAFDFHPAFGLGYRTGPWSIEASVGHTSNAGLGHPNEGMNNLGIWLGRRF